VRYEKAINFTNDTLLVYSNISKAYSIDGKAGVKAEYFNNEKLEGAPAVTQIENDIDHYWAEGQTPRTGIGTMHYSGRYTTNLTAGKDAVMNFEIEGDDGYRLLIDGKQIIDAWTRNRWGRQAISVAGKKRQQL
jgi:beta-glucosidase